MSTVNKTRDRSHPQNPHNTDTNATGPKSSDPLHKIPVVGQIVKQTDQLRHRLPLIGEHLTRTDADLLRMEARLLRLVASRMEARANQLERLSKKDGEGQPRRIQVE